MATIATDTLIKSTCLFIQSNGLEMHRDISMTPLREGGQLLLPLFHNENPSIEFWSFLNRCRLFLQVAYVSEVCTGDGLAI